MGVFMGPPELLERLERLEGLEGLECPMIAPQGTQPRQPA
jgi:hypothetical protein